MDYTLEQIYPKEYKGDLILLHGSEVADRTMPLAKKELEYLRSRCGEEKETVVVFDRLPHHLYVVCFDSEQEEPLCQERLRRLADQVVGLLKADKVASVAVTGVGVIAEEVVAFVEGLQLADYSFDRYKGKKPYHLEHVAVDSTFLTPE